MDALAPASPPGAVCEPQPEIPPSPSVERADLESELAALRAGVADPKAGLFGPGSRIWDVNREAVIFMGGARAALLQLAHPYVAAAIDQHSTTRRDARARFQGTFRNVFAMVWGDLEEAFTAARRVHAVHSRIRGRLAEPCGELPAGSPYLANDPEALLWVHATLWDTSVLVFELVVRRLADEEKERYYAETRLFAKLFGIPDRLLPASWGAFQEYNARMWTSGRLGVGRAAREIGDFLFEARQPWLAPPMAWLRRMTAGLMPEPLGEAFGLAKSRSQRMVFDLSLRALRATRPLWPGRLRFVPPYLAALRRIAGDTGADPTGDFLTRLWLGSDASR
jgi:uncharacterized protein (DUF2236 family)